MRRQRYINNRRVRNECVRFGSEEASCRGLFPDYFFQYFVYAIGRVLRGTHATTGRWWMWKGWISIRLSWDVLLNDFESRDETSAVAYFNHSSQREFVSRPFFSIWIDKIQQIGLVNVKLQPLPLQADVSTTVFHKQILITLRGIYFLS
jgi:hypothetical protein